MLRDILVYLVIYLIMTAILVVVTEVFAQNAAVSGTVALVCLAMMPFAIHGNLKEDRRKKRAKEEGRGRKMANEARAKKATDIKRKPSDPGVLWGTQKIPSENARWHFCVVGAVGSGKTLTIRMLLNDQLPLITPGSNRRAIIYDSKIDMVQIVRSLDLKCPQAILNPFDTRGVGWHMASDIDSPTSARQLANTLVPQNERENNPFFSNAVRELLYSVVMVFIKTRPEKWSLRELLLVMRSKELLKLVLKGHPETEQTVSNFLDVGEETVGNIMASIIATLGPYEAIAAAWEKTAQKISIKKWVQSESVLILGNDERVRSTLDKVNQLFVAMVAQHVLSQPDSETRMSWFIFDEFREAGKLEGLKGIILRGRSKGCCVVLGFQDIQGVREVYGPRVGEEIVGQCGNKAFLCIESHPTAEWASKAIGSLEFKEETPGVSHGPQGSTTSYNTAIVTRPQVMPEEIMELPVPDRENGLHGFYIVRGIGCFPAHYPPKDLNKFLGVIDENIESQIPAPVDWQYLKPWTKEDARQLGLVQEDEPQQHKHHHAHNDKKPSLDDIGRVSN